MSLVVLPDNKRGCQRVLYKSSMSLRLKCCHFGGVLVARCTGNCHSHNFQCGRRRRLRRDRHAFVSVNKLWAFDELAHIDNLIVYPHSMIELPNHWLVYFDLISFYFLVFHLEFYSYKHYSYCGFYIVFTIICNVILLYVLCIILCHIIIYFSFYDFIWQVPWGLFNDQCYPIRCYYSCHLMEVTVIY